MLLLAMPGPAMRCDILAPLAGAATTKAGAHGQPWDTCMGAGGKLKLDIEYNKLENLEAAKAAWLVYLCLLPYWALLGFTGLYWALLGLTWPYWALLRDLLHICLTN